MNARIVRMKKEARALVWPWCAIMIVGALPAILPHYDELASWMSFTMGIPLLATLSLGNEFQHRTLSLWLTQPSNRMQLWAEKMIIMSVAVISAALVSGIVMFSFTWPQQDFLYKVAAIAYVIVTTASATFWTLTARSTIGGLVLNWVQWWPVYFPIFFLVVPKGSLPRAATINAISVFGICYAGLMLWLGARKLARFQVTGGSAGDAPLMTGPTVIPGALAGWLRSRPSGAFLNLIRKELRLLLPLWLLTLLVVLYLAVVAMFRLLPNPFFVPVPLMAILAGSLSMGEERTSGTQAWHMTLPVSARRQWLIKLVMAVLAGIACSMLLRLHVLLAGGSVRFPRSLSGSGFMVVDFHSLPFALFLIPLLSFASFWCACAANGTVRAAIWVLPVTIVTYLACASGLWLGQELAQTTGTLKDLVVSWFHLSPLPFPIELSSPKPGVIIGDLFLACVAAILFGVIQSYRLFRTQPPDGALWMLRCLLPLAAVSILWCFSLSAGLVSSRWRPFDETRQALDKFHPEATKLELTGEDLAKSSPLTAPTRRWLRGSSIVVAPDHSHLSGYLATIHLAGGLKCRLIVAHYGGLAASCAYKGP